MNYKRAENFLYSQLPYYSKQGKTAINPGLKNIKKLLQQLGNPQESFKSIHIAGTNGKGTATALITSVFSQTAYNVGCYTSPHLIQLTERIKVNRKNIGRKHVVNFLGENMKAIEKIEPSFFELMFAMSLWYFKKKNVEIAVIETGLGGRLDSTNIINPILSIITHVGLDHQEILGNTLEKIAKEKAGIIKERTPVIIGDNHESISHIFREKAMETDADIFFSQKESTLFAQSEDFFHYRSKNWEMKVISPFRGRHQQQNLQTVLFALDVLRHKTKLSLTKKKIQRGIKHTKSNMGFRGRWDILSQKPKVICDVGHNMAAFEFIFEQLKQEPHEKLFMFLSFVQGKDYENIIQKIPKRTRCFFYEMKVERALSLEKMKLVADEAGLKYECCSDFRSTFTHILKQMKGDDLLFVGGSTFMVSQILKLYKAS